MTRVAFQGERGAYSELAVRAHFGAADAIACRQFTDVIDLLASSAVEHAVLPVENSLAGAVPGVAELLLDQRVGVDTELWLPIHHCLLVLHIERKLIDGNIVFSLQGIGEFLQTLYTPAI